MNKYLYCFGYEAPEEQRSNMANGTDYESCSAVWIVANTKEDAIRTGISYAQNFVYVLFESAGIRNGKWDCNKFANWIEDDPDKKWPINTLDHFETISA